MGCTPGTAREAIEEAGLGAACIGKDIVNPLRQQLMHQQFPASADDGFRST